MVKVGDTVVSVSDSDRDITIGNVYVVDAVSERTLSFRDDAGDKRTRLLRDYRVISAPPQKIQQDGYEYSLVGSVKPDWLVNGVWVVEKETGILYRITVVSGGFICVDKTGLGERKELDYITSNFRPHTASDYKWGDWAMYSGRKVFVIEEGNWKGDIRVSHPDLPDRVDYVPVLQLTPTF